MSVANKTPAELYMVDRLAALTFRNLLALTTEANNGPIGFDPNRGPNGSWQGGNLKPKLAEWALQNADWNKLIALLPKYESRSEHARKWVAATKSKSTGAQTVPRTKKSTDWYERMQEDKKRSTWQGEDWAQQEHMEATAAQDPKRAQPLPNTSPTPKLTAAEEQQAEQARAAYEQMKALQAEQTKQEPAKDEGTTVARVREIAREEAQKLDALMAEQFALAQDEIERQANRIQDSVDDINEEIAKLRAAQGITVVLHHADTGKVDTTKLGRQHTHFDKLLKRASLRDRNGNAYNIWLTGPAGSGKTTAAENVAKALKLEFHFSGAIDNEFKLLGFIDAAGRCIRTAFREAYEHGGIFLLDEVDGCHAGALLALNAALANGYCDFPDTKIKRHKDCIILAAANTWGTGATHDYIGRNKLDAASLDRFIMLDWPYDEEMERDLSGNAAWCARVQKLRANALKVGIKHVISPRATYVGAAMLAGGIEEADVLQEIVYKGLSADNISKLTRGY